MVSDEDHLLITSYSSPSLKKVILMNTPIRRKMEAIIYPIESKNGPNDKIFQTKRPIRAKAALIQKRITCDFRLTLKI
jgi:hypothetical protein